MSDAARRGDQRIGEGLRLLDTVRSEGLRQATLVQRVRDQGASRERDRLAAKYGDAHPRVTTATARAAAARRLADAVADEAERVKSPPPRVDDDTWMVQGRVLRRSGSPGAGLTVSLSAPEGNWERAAGHVCTDQRGGFALRYQPQGVARAVHLTVSDDVARVLHRDPAALTPTPGVVSTRVVLLEEDSCPPPEDEPGTVGRADAWTVRGRVTDAQGSPAAGLTVSLYDEDLIFDDRLGSTTTNADGDYRFTYRTSDFRDFIERRPDLYLKVLDAAGRTLHSTQLHVRAKAGREEVFDVRLPAPRKGRG